ncbi:MAG: STAS domain-containing protein [Clostridia bacterium]|nr:STAS domain-containing protein [Clostridia bacterium]
MEIIKNQNGTSLEIAIEGRLDTMTAPEFEAEISNAISGITSLVLDFAKLEYVSSAGLRVILSAQKIMNKQGEMKIKNVNSEIMDVFEITGFSDILTIE